MFRVLRVLNLNQSKSFHLISEMPKSKKSTSENKNKNSSDKVPVKNNDNGAVFLGSNSEIILKIHAKPGAKESSITDVGTEAVGVQIGAPPIDGDANKELIRYLAEVLNLRRSDLSLDKGSRSRNKTVVISKEVSLNDVMDALNAASNK